MGADRITSPAAAVAALVLTVVACWFAPTIAAADDWPRWRGPRGDGISQETGLLETWPAGLKPLWSAEVGKGYSGPVATDGRVYLFSLIGGDDTLRCYDASTGKPIWTQSYDGGWEGGYSGTRATPYIEGDRIYTLGGTGELTSRELTSGKQIWRTNVMGKGGGGSPLSWAQASNPLIDGDLIYVQGGSGGRVGIGVDKNSGQIVWRSEVRATGGYAHPILADVQGHKQLILFTAGGPMGIDPASGRTIWQRPFKNGSEVSASDPIYRDGHLFVTSAYGLGALMLKITPTGAQPVWENRAIEGRFQPAILDGDYLYVNSEGTLVCMKWPNNEIKWKTANRDKNLLGLGGSIVRVGGDKMILLSQSGRLTLAKATPEGFAQISTIPDFVEGSEVWATPAIHDGKLFAKGDTELVCVRIKAE
jgi:outer membrane protein assembly factor BamB